MDGRRCISGLLSKSREGVYNYLYSILRITKEQYSYSGLLKLGLKVYRLIWYLLRQLTDTIFTSIYFTFIALPIVRLDRSHKYSEWKTAQYRSFSRQYMFDSIYLISFTSFFSLNFLENISILCTDYINYVEMSALRRYQLSVVYF